jgi:CheY-like chemotaxis protein
MVYGVAERHSADLEIESAVGQGTTICLSFLAAASLVAGPGPAEGPLAPLSSMRILLVDDDPLLVYSLRDFLETDGHFVITANGGQAGIQAFLAAQDRRQPFDVVLTDLGMPHVDGRRVARAIKSASPSTPVILLTGWGQRLAAERDIPPHVDQVLNKPPKLRELRQALARCSQPVKAV